MLFAPNRLFKISISVRIAVLFCLTFAAGLVIAFFATYLQLSFSLERASKEVISAKLQETSAVLKTGGVKGLRDFLSEENNRILNAPFMVRVMTSHGENLYLKASVQEKAFDFEEGLKIQSSPENNLGWHALSAINDEDKFDMLTEKAGSDFYLQVGKSSEDREEILGRLLNVFIVSGGFLILLGGGLGLWYARKSLAPIRDLVSAISNIEKGDLSQRVDISRSQDELKELGETFNRMIARIESVVRIMRESLDNVAHDIRTPLTRIRAVAEDALVSVRPDSLKNALEDCAESASGISALVDQLLSVSEADAGTLILKNESCDVKPLIDEVVDIYEFVLLEKKISVEIIVDANVSTWKLDRKRIKQVIGNLIDNAIKFSPAETKIQIITRLLRDGQLEISIQDEGGGLSQTDSVRIWDRLYRGDKSRTTKGSGLGLSIVRSIVHAHGGSVTADSNSGRGSTFSIVLPPSV